MADDSTTSAPASVASALWGWLVYLEQLDIILMVVGLMGSVCLLSSNYLSHQAITAMGLSCCHGNHGHRHTPNHGKSARCVTIVTPLDEHEAEDEDEVLPLTAQERL